MYVYFGFFYRCIHKNEVAPPPILYGLLLKKHVLILIRGINGRPGRGVDLEIRTHPDRGGLKIQDFGGRPLQSAPYSTLVFS